MSRTTVHRLLGLSEPPRYRRVGGGSQVDAFAEVIGAMLDEDPKVPATVIAQRLRRQGFTGSLTILKDHLRRVRPTFAAARVYQRTSYEPGELAQTDWWEPGISVPVGRGQSREVFGLVTGLRFSAGFRVVFAFNQTVAAFAPALVGGLRRLGGPPKAMVSDNDGAFIVAHRRGGLVTLVDEVAALYGQLGLKPVPLRPFFSEGKGFIERMNQFLETSFLPLRTFSSISDLQAQADGWSVQVADRRRVRRINAVVADALAVERDWLRPAPAVWPDVDQRLEVRASSDGFVRVGDVDYSVPPRFARRRVEDDHAAELCGGRRGRGASGDAQQYILEREADDLVAVVDTTGAPAAVLGHSYGAMCALEAVTRTARITRLVLYEPGFTQAWFAPHGLIEQLTALLAAGDRDAVVTTFMREIPRVPPAQLAVMRSQPAWQGRVKGAHTIPREL